MCIFLNKVFYRCSLFCLAKTDRPPARTGELLHQVLVTPREAWHWAPEFAAWMKPSPSLPPPAAAALGPSAAGKQTGKSQPQQWNHSLQTAPWGCGTAACDAMNAVAGARNQLAGALAFSWAQLMTFVGMSDPGRSKQRKKNPNLTRLFLSFFLSFFYLWRLDKVFVV